MFTKHICHKKRLGFILLFLIQEMLIWNCCYEKRWHFLFLPERGEFVPKLAAVFTPSSWKKGASLSCEWDYRRSSLHHGGGVGRVWFGIGPSCLSSSAVPFSVYFLSSSVDFTDVQLSVYPSLVPFLFYLLGKFQPSWINIFVCSPQT